MAKWEYTVETWTLSITSSDLSEFEQELNEYGNERWELVTIIPRIGEINGLRNVEYNQLVFKRKLED